MEYALHPPDKQALDQLARPCTIERLADQMRDTEHFDAERCVDALLKRGLLFEEEGAFMSLVLPYEPPPRRRWDQWPTGWRVW